MARGQHSMGELAAMDRYMPISGMPPISELTGMERYMPMGAQHIAPEVPYDLGGPMHGHHTPYDELELPKDE